MCEVRIRDVSLVIGRDVALLSGMWPLAARAFRLRFYLYSLQGRQMMAEICVCGHFYDSHIGGTECVIVDCDCTDFHTV